MTSVRGLVFSLLASRCLSCGAVVSLQTGTVLYRSLCSGCYSQLQPRRGGYCPLCGEMIPDSESSPLVCGQCRRNPPPWSKLAFYGSYTGLLRELLMGFKFNNRLGLGRLMQAMAVEACRLHGVLTAPPDIIVPVPLHARRLVTRGFNQSLELAREVAREMECPLNGNILTRRRHTPPQAGRPAKERKQNVQGAFAAEPDAVCDQRVLLVDDIMTTGGTLRECTSTLLRAGAAEVSVLVVARTESQRL